MYRLINTSSILAREIAMFFSVHPYTECKLHLESHVTSVAECNDISKVLHLYCFHDLFRDDFDYLSDYFLCHFEHRVSFIESDFL